MLSKAFTLLTTVLFLSPISNGQVSLEMEPIEANSTITDVTLYRNRAAITRTAILDLKVGGYTMFFRDLPSSAYLDSVQASVGDNAKLLSVDTSSRPRTEDNSEIIKGITAEIEDVEKQIDTLNARQDSLALQITMLKTLIEQASNAKEGPVDLDALENQLEFIGTKMTSLTVDRTTNEKALKELKKTLQNLRQRKQNLSVNRGTQLNAVVDIGVTQPGKIQVQLTYLVNNASWQPTYSIRANNAGDKITVEYDAELWQRTGENWTDVAMTLSTAQPQQSTTPPMPSPWFVDVYVPPPPTSTGLGGRRESYRAKNSDALHMRRTGLAIEEMAMDAMVVETASAFATVNNDGPAVSFSLPRTVTVPSNREDKQTTSLGAFETEAEMFHVAAPMLTDSTFIRSNVTNTSEYILLPGQASIFHGSDYVGKTSLPTIAPNETFPLDLGIDPVVTATRVLLEKEATTTGLFGSGKQTQYEYRITISNGHTEAIEVHLWDRYPVSRNEEIEITLKDLSSPLSTNQKYVDSEKPMGLLRWDLTIPAQSTGDASFVLSWRVEVARGKDIEMTPLPE
ncbi:MAG: mucoidy inhibitor MuiA family protein [Phycisphaerales bacterium]|nr:mucoidy inhibitor MuiA family protein [Planctomycetota bacterium]MBL6997435.1 mucoidy inhibitor MuiA family protein [Phycisphaerales bacterium]